MTPALQLLNNAGSCCPGNTSTRLKYCIKTAAQILRRRGEPRGSSSNTEQNLSPPLSAGELAWKHCWFREQGAYVSAKCNRSQCTNWKLGCPKNDPPSEEFGEIGKAELPLMTNNHCGMGFLAGHLENRCMTDSLLPNLINWCLSLSHGSRDVGVFSPLSLCPFCHPR